MNENLFNDIKELKESINGLENKLRCLKTEMEQHVRQLDPTRRHNNYEPYEHNPAWSSPYNRQQPISPFNSPYGPFNMTRNSFQDPSSYVRFGENENNKEFHYEFKTINIVDLGPILLVVEVLKEMGSVGICMKLTTKYKETTDALAESIQYILAPLDLEKTDNGIKLVRK